MREYGHKKLYPFKKVISSTQFLDYEKNPQDFYMRWVLGVKQIETPPMLVGRIFSELFADRKFDFRAELIAMGATYYIEIFERAIKLFPALPASQCEHELTPSFKGFKLRATLDGKTDDMIIENKTGKTEWTQYRADTSDQITFQSFCWYLKYKQVPPRIMLNWVDCRSKNPAKPVRTFYTQRTEQQLLEFKPRVEVVIEKIKVEDWGV
jgi:hypothetical protein